MAQTPSKTEWTNQTKALNDINRNLAKLIKEVIELQRMIKVDGILRVELVNKPEKKEENG